MRIRNEKEWRAIFRNDKRGFERFLDQYPDIRDRNIKVTHRPKINSHGTAYSVWFNLPSIIHDQFSNEINDLGMQRISTTFGIYLNPPDPNYQTHIYFNEIIPLEKSRNCIHPHTRGVRYDKRINRTVYRTCMGEYFDHAIHTKNFLQAYLVAESIVNNVGEDGMEQEFYMNYGGYCSRCGEICKPEEISRRRICKFCRTGYW